MKPKPDFKRKHRMKNRHTITLSIMLVLITSLPISFAQDSHLWESPKGVKACLGKGWVTDMTFSPDGNQLAVTSSTGIWLYNINTGKEEAFLKGHTELVTSVAYSPDGQTLASASNDWTVRLWDVRSRQHIKTLQAHKAPVNTVTYSPDGNTLASGGNDGILLWNVEDWQHRHIFKGKSASTTSLVYSPDDQTLTSGSRDGKIHLWDTIDGRRTQTFSGHEHEQHVVPERYAQYLTSLAYSPDGNTLASWSNGELLLLDSVNGMPMETVDFYKFQVSSLTFSHSGSIIVTGCHDGSIYFWDKDDLTQIRKLQGHVDKVTSVVYSPNSNIYASASMDGTIRLWDTVGKLPKRIIIGHTPYVACIMYSPDGSTLASGGMNGDVHLWNAETGQYIQTLVELTDMEKAPKVKNNHSQSGRFRKMVTSIAYSPDGKFLTYGTMDNKIHIWDTKKEKYLRMLDPHSDEKHTYSDMHDIRHSHSVYALAYSPDGKILVSGSENGKILLWNPKRGWWYKTSKTPKGAVTAVTFSPDSKTFISNGNGNKIDVWDVKRAEHKQSLEVKFNTGSITSVAYSPDGRTIAAGCIDKTIYCWNAGIGVLRQILSGHTARVTSVSFSPDGKLLASSSYDRTIRLWNTETGQHQQTISGHLGRVTSVTFSPNGRTLASASDDGTVLIWDLQHFIQTMVPENDKNSKLNLSQRYLPIDAKVRIGKGMIKDIVYSPDGSRLAVASSIGTWIYDAHTGSEIALFGGPTMSMDWLSYSPNGKMLSGGNKDGIYSFDAVTGRNMYLISLISMPSRYAPKPFVYSPDGSMIVSGWDNTPIQLWDAVTGQHKQTINAAMYRGSVALSPDGTTIAYSQYDIGIGGKIQLWDVVKGKHKRTLSGHKHGVETIVFAPDGKMIASIGKNINGVSSSSKDKEILLWDAETGNIKHSLTHNWIFDELLFSPDAKILASGSNIRIYLWDVTSGKIRHKLNGGVPFAYASDGKTIAGVSGNTIKIWHVSTGELMHELSGHRGQVNSLEYSPNDRTLVSLGETNQIIFWDADTGRLKRTIVHPSLGRMRFSPDGTKLIMTGSSGNEYLTFCHWDVKTGKLKVIPTYSKTKLHSNAYYRAQSHSYSPDGKTLATGSLGAINLWDTGTGQHKQIFIGHGDYDVYTVKYSPDGRTLASGGGDKKICLWNIESGQLVKTFSGHTDSVQSLAYSTDGKTLASGSRDKTVRLWDAATGTHKQTLTGHTDTVSALVFSPDNKTLVSRDKRFRFWDAETGKSKQVLLEHPHHKTYDVYSPSAYSPDSKIIVTEGGNSSIQLWNRESERLIRTLNGHPHLFTSFLFTPDGNRLASGCSDGTILLWDLTSTHNTSD